MDVTPSPNLTHRLPHTRRHARRWVRYVLCAILLTTFAAPAMTGCQPQPERSPSMDDGTELQDALRAFHKNLRWARYDHAAKLVADSYEPTFSGRYEELGEDFHMVSLEVTDVEMQKGDKKASARAMVTLEQQWYIEPNMSVKKEKFVELWARTPAGWRLTERLEKKVWREREKERKAREAEKAPVEDEATPKES